MLLCALFTRRVRAAASPAPLLPLLTSSSHSSLSSSLSPAVPIEKAWAHAFSMGHPQPRLNP